MILELAMSTTSQSQSESGTYDYEQELDDENDVLSFGKFKDLTPAQLASTEVGRNYIVWAHHNTHHWVGSETLVRQVHKIANEIYIPRVARPIRRTASEPIPDDNIVAACEAATLEAFGCFPKPRWAY